MFISEIKQLKEGNRFSSLVVVAECSLKDAKNGSKFLDFTISDKTGVMKAKIWDYTKGSVPKLGDVWNVNGIYSPYNGKPQCVVDKYAEVDKTTIDKSLFIPSLSKEEISFYTEKLNTLIGKIQNVNLRRFVKDTLYDVYPQFLWFVGARNNHHARLGGLLQHTTNVASIALSSAKSYTGTEIENLINTDFLIAGALLHDLGKIGEYTIEDGVIDNSFEGYLARHYDTGTMYLINAYEKLGKPIDHKTFICLCHILVTHHGIDLSERPPSSISAFIIHAADLADSFIDGIKETILNGTRPDGLSIEDCKLIKNKVLDESKIWVKK